MSSLFFGSWREVIRIAMAAVVGYAVLLVLLRGYGKRAIAKMNISDFVITVAIGSTLAAFVMSRDIPILDGVVGLSLLVTIQFFVMRSTGSEIVRKAIEGAPTLLVYEGRLLPDQLAREHVTESEVNQAVRSEGHASLDQVMAVVLEVDGNFSVIPRGAEKRGLLRGTEGAPPGFRSRRAG